MDVIRAAYEGVSYLFGQWFWGYLFIPFFLSVVGGIIGANLGVYRELQRRVFDEMRYIRRRVFPSSRDRGTAAWSNTRIHFSTEIETLCTELRFRGHERAASAYESAVAKIRNKLTELDESSWAEVQRDNPDSLRNEDRYDDKMRRAVRVYLDAELPKLCSQILDQKPDWAAILDTPSLRPENIRRLLSFRKRSVL